MLKTEAEQFLHDAQGLPRSEARQIVKDSSLWRLENRRQGKGKQAVWCLLPKNGGNGNDPKNPHEMGSPAAHFVAAQARSGRQRQVLEKATIGANFQSTEVVAEEECEESSEVGDDLSNEPETKGWEKDL